MVEHVLAEGTLADLAGDAGTRGFPLRNKAAGSFVLRGFREVSLSQKHRKCVLNVRLYDLTAGVTVAAIF